MNLRKICLAGIFSLTMAAVIFSCTSEKYFQVNRVDMPSDTFSFKTNVQRFYREDYYLIETNVTKSDTLSKKISEFVATHPTAMDTVSKYDQFVMYFFKSTSKLNEGIIKEYPSNLRYKAFIGIKPLCKYVWFNGKLIWIEPNF